jgi:hypothetical protein
MIAAVSVLTLRTSRLPPPSDEADVGELCAALDGLQHVVERESGDRDRGQRLHLDAGRAGRGDRLMRAWSGGF